MGSSSAAALHVKMASVSFLFFLAFTLFATFSLIEGQDDSEGSLLRLSKYGRFGQKELRKEKLKEKAVQKQRGLGEKCGNDDDCQGLLYCKDKLCKEDQDTEKKYWGPEDLP